VVIGVAPPTMVAIAIAAIATKLDLQPVFSTKTGFHFFMLKSK